MQENPQEYFLEAEEQGIFTRFMCHWDCIAVKEISE
jgi:hypothetical protein